ncbi:MAG: RDD family protein [Candidatus Sumerlaeaceae bacterium]|nr:RDD family protein [Candidatus Sumerlaeaceae bacterium]
MKNRTENRVRQIDSLTFVIYVDHADERHSVHRVAGIGSRLLACLYDGFLQAVVAATVVLGCIQMNYQISFPLWLLFFAGAHVAYHFVFELLTDGQSPGKNVLGLRVVSIYGTRPRVWQLLARNMARVVDFLPICYFAGGVRAVFTLPSRRWGDELAGTVVICAEPFADMLTRIQCGPAAYNVSPDAYLLESFVLRQNLLPAQVLSRLAHLLADYFAKRYGFFGEAQLIDLYQRGDYGNFLMALYRREQTAAQASDHGNVVCE